jgi:hypothetical protein
MNFLEKFDIGQIIGLILIFTAAIDKFLLLDIVVNKIAKTGSQSEDEINKIKKILTLGINAGAVILALLGFIFLFGIFKI